MNDEKVPKGTKFKYKGKEYVVTEDTDPFLLMGYLLFDEEE